MGLAALSLVARYRAAGPDVRSQIRWFMVAGTLVTITLVPLAQLFVFVSPREGRGQDLWVTFFVCASLFPAAIWLAITRHRLYDIDRLVNRAFVHGTMIALLAGVFTASIGLSQRLFVHVTGDTSDVAIVLTTLVAAAAYTTVRRRLERLADRLFRYDAPRLGAFSQSVHEMVTLLDPEETARRMLGEAIGVLHACGGWVELDDDTLDIAALPVEGSTDRSAAGCAPALSVAIPGRSGPIGRLVVGPRLGGAPYHQRDAEVLEEFAALLGRALELRPARPTCRSGDRRRHHRLGLADRPATQALGEPLAI